MKNEAVVGNELKGKMQDFIQILQACHSSLEKKLHVQKVGREDGKVSHSVAVLATCCGSPAPFAQSTPP